MRNKAQISKLQKDIQAFNQEVVRALFSAVVHARNERDPGPLNECVKSILDIKFYDFDLYAIRSYLNKEFGILWNPFNEVFYVPVLPRIKLGKLKRLAPDSVIKEINGYQRGVKKENTPTPSKTLEDNLAFFRRFNDLGEKDKSHGPFGTPKDASYNKYKIKTKRK